MSYNYSETAEPLPYIISVVLADTLFYKASVYWSGIIHEACQSKFARPVNVGRKANFGECSILNPTFIGFEETSSYWPVQSFSVFHWQPSIGKPRMTSVSLVTIAVRYPVWPHTFVFSSADSRGAVVSYLRKYVHEVLVNRLGGLSLPRKSVVRLTDRPDITLEVTRGRKTTTQHNTTQLGHHHSTNLV